MCWLCDDLGFLTPSAIVKGAWVPIAKEKVSSQTMVRACPACEVEKIHGGWVIKVGSHLVVELLPNIIESMGLIAGDHIIYRRNNNGKWELWKEEEWAKEMQDSESRG